MKEAINGADLFILIGSALLITLNTKYFKNINLLMSYNAYILPDKLFHKKK
jgi:hypothetical protein